MPQLRQLRRRTAVQLLGMRCGCGNALENARGRSRGRPAPAPRAARARRFPRPASRRPSSVRT